MTFITLSKAEEITGIKSDTLKKRCQDGIIFGAFKVGKTWFVPRNQMSLLNSEHKDQEIENSSSLNYEGFQIELWNKGFDPRGNLHLIVSYLVHKPGIFCVFAFREGLLERMSNPDIKEEQIERMQLEEIAEKIDNKEIKHLEEYPFQFYGTNYLPDDNATWWQKTLKNN